MIKPTYFLQKIKMYIAENIIYKNIILYNFAIYLLRHINLFLPHENDIYGLRYLKLNRNSKIRTSYGTGFLFPALYEGHEYGWSNASSISLNLP